MRDTPFIYAALALFILLVGTPAWVSMARGTAAARPALAAPEKGTLCVAPSDYMRSSHMLLLDEWRQSAVRDGIRTYTTHTGAEVKISLSGTCLRCHGSRADFCDRCHSYAGVNPSCANCHVDPGTGPGGK